MKYRANRNTAIFPFGLIARGEALCPEHIEALGGEALEALVARGVLVRIGGPAPVTDAPEDAGAGREIDAAEPEIDDAAEDEAEQAEAPADEMAGLDDLMGEAEPEPEGKPGAKKATRGRKAR